MEVTTTVDTVSYNTETGAFSKRVSRSYILDMANKCVNGDREGDYGSPENSFNTIANLWTDYINAVSEGDAIVISAKDVAAMLALLKIARIATGHKKDDNWIDLAGYAACGGEIQANE